jgi:hypothetical protein
MAKVGVIMLDGKLVGDIELDDAVATASGFAGTYSGPLSDFPGVPGIGGGGAPRFGHGGDGRGRGGRGGGGGGDGGPRHYEPEWHPADPKFRRKRPGQKPESEAPQREPPAEWHPADPRFQRKRPEDPAKPKTDPAEEQINEEHTNLEEAPPWRVAGSVVPPKRRGPWRPDREHVEDPEKPAVTEEDEALAWARRDDPEAQREAQREAHRGAHRDHEVKAKPPPLRGLAPPKTEETQPVKQKDASAMPAPKGWAPPKYTDVESVGTSVGGDATAADVPVQPEDDARPRMGAGGPGDLNKQSFDQMFNGTPMEGKFDRVTDLARQHGIPPALFGAIIAHETGKGTSSAMRDKNNPAGISGTGSPWTFPSVDAGLEKSAEVIAKNWRNAHENLDELAEIYSPTKGATNDPGNLNRGWPAGVRHYMAQLGVPGKAGPIATYDMPSGFGPIAQSLASDIPVAKIAQYAASDSGFVGTGGYNFMGSERAREMGMGDVGHGSSAAQQLFQTGIPRSAGPSNENISEIKANKYAGPDMAGFLHDLYAAGAPLKDFAGAYVPKALQHGYGNALDIETGFGSGPDNSAALYRWSQAHPKEFEDIQAKHHMRNLDTSSGASLHDWGHFEWTPARRATAAEMATRRGGGTVAQTPATQISRDLDALADAFGTAAPTPRAPWPRTLPSKGNE